MIRFTFNIKKLHFIIILFVIIVVGVVIAYGTNNPPVFGHTSSEIDLVGSGISQPMPLNTWVTTTQTSVTNHGMTLLLCKLMLLLYKTKLIIVLLG